MKPHVATKRSKPSTWDHINLNEPKRLKKNTMDHDFQAWISTVLLVITYNNRGAIMWAILAHWMQLRHQNAIKKPVSMVEHSQVVQKTTPPVKTKQSRQNILQGGFSMGLRAWRNKCMGIAPSTFATFMLGYLQREWSYQSMRYVRTSPWFDQAPFVATLLPFPCILFCDALWFCWHSLVTLRQTN